MKTQCKTLTYVVSSSDGVTDAIIETFTDGADALDFYNQCVEEHSRYDSWFDLSVYSDFSGDANYIDTIAFWQSEEVE